MNDLHTPHNCDLNKHWLPVSQISNMVVIVSLGMRHSTISTDSLNELGNPALMSWRGIIAR